MICISIAQESRRLALVDMLNAAGQCDLIHVRLDRFEKAADIKELVKRKPRPIIMSCRRVKDGGLWEGSETERLALLRQAVIDKSDYVEIEVDVADQIRPFPGCKRVISYTNLQETPANIADIYAECRSKQPDVIKLTTLASTPEEAWPLVQILAKATEPTVVQGIGKPGVMLAILAKKLGAPWIYAALEKGMETLPGQVTISELENIYHYRAIEKGTRLIGVTGFEEAQVATVAALNTVLAQMHLPARCLPLGIGSMDIFRKVIDATKLAAVVVDEAHRLAILDIAQDIEPLAREAASADLLLYKDHKWHAYNMLTRAAITALEDTVRAKSPSDKPLNGRMIMIVGTNATAETMTFAVKKRGGAPIIAGRDRDAAHRIAQKHECRYVQLEALYSTVHEILIVCSEEKMPVKGKHGEETGIHPGFLKPGHYVMDLTTVAEKSKFLREAEDRCCEVVSPRQILIDMLVLQLRLITGKDAPRGLVEEAVNVAIGEEASRHNLE
jgi:3-dehydroquinate dehydratase / shikimate dehydrogenase